MFDFIPKAYAACDTSKDGLKLTDCLILNDKGQTVANVYKDPAFLINLVVRNLFIIAGIIIFFMIIYAGFLFVSEDKKGPDRAREVVTSAIVGFIIMFAAYWILQIIKLVTGADLVSF
jgi:RsiW-degrading membrane proteinase PrsW (M82 family)